MKVRDAGKFVSIEPMVILARKQITWLPNVMPILADATNMGAEIDVVEGGRAFRVTYIEPKYNDQEVFNITVDYSENSEWDLTRLSDFVVEYKEIKAERERVANLKASALSKLSAEERKVLGL